MYHPDRFQGKNRRRHYFEGWYFKITDLSAENTLALIPGISYGDDDSDKHAFIQVLDAKSDLSQYFQFDASTFFSSHDSFMISIEKNLFHSKGMAVSLKNDHAQYYGKLTFREITPFPRTLFSRGIMGPFGWIPFMECHHDILNIRHTLAGTLVVNGKEICFDMGTGYLEKDWGTSFPESWIWLQCNHFKNSKTSFMLSYARIPFMGTSFKGLIAFIQTENSFYKIATYNGAKVTSLDIGKNNLTLIVESKKHALNISVDIKAGGLLRTPKNGRMVASVLESMTSEISICLIEKNGKMLIKEKGIIAGVELDGDMAGLNP